MVKIVMTSKTGRQSSNLSYVALTNWSHSTHTIYCDNKHIYIFSHEPSLLPAEGFDRKT